MSYNDVALAIKQKYANAEQNKALAGMPPEQREAWRKCKTIVDTLRPPDRVALMDSLITLMDSVVQAKLARPRTSMKADVELASHKAALDVVKQQRTKLQKDKASLECQLKAVAAADAAVAGPADAAYARASVASMGMPDIRIDVPAPPPVTVNAHLHFEPGSFQLTEAEKGDMVIESSADGRQTHIRRMRKPPGPIARVTNPQ